eukprot:403373822
MDPSQNQQSQQSLDQVDKCQDLVVKTLQTFQDMLVDFKQEMTSNSLLNEEDLLTNLGGGISNHTQLRNRQQNVTSAQDNVINRDNSMMDDDDFPIDNGVEQSSFLDNGLDTQQNATINRAQHHQTSQHQNMATNIDGGRQNQVQLSQEDKMSEICSNLINIQRNLHQVIDGFKSFEPPQINSFTHINKKE